MESDEGDALACRILQNLEQVWESETSLTEYDFLPSVGESGNRNPLILEKDKLAIEQWCLKTLYTYVHRHFHLAVKKKKSRLQYSDQSKGFHLSFITQVLLMLNPEHMTAWNHRKSLLVLGCISVSDEIKVMDLILGKFPKSPETFAHRKYVVQRSMNTLESASGTLMRNEIIDHELKICILTADKYPNNYNSWSHRIWVMTTFVWGTSQTDDYIKQEQDTMTTFVNGHISDYSGFHYKQFLVKTVCEKFSKSDMDLIFHREMKESLEMISYFPDHEALWCHRKALLNLYMNYLRNKETVSENVVMNKKCKVDHHSKESSGGDGLSPCDGKDLLQNEKYIFTNFDKCKAAWETLLNQRYLKWIGKISDLV